PAVRLDRAGELGPGVSRAAIEPVPTGPQGGMTLRASERGKNDESPTTAGGRHLFLVPPVWPLAAQTRKRWLRYGPRTISPTPPWPTLRGWAGRIWNSSPGARGN